MKLWSKSATALALSGLLMQPTSTAANNLHQTAPKFHSEVLTILQVQKNESEKSIVKVLSDHPGRATALTKKQKSEIRKILANSKANTGSQGDRSFICTGLSLSGQRESMYRVVRLRAKLVCNYAKSVDPSIKISVKEKVIKTQNLNGRVEVASK
ncbi:MAG: hypothetical protein ACO3GT_07900 [Candidatus Nanopelagicales bacterium]